MNLNSFQWRSLKTRVTLFTLAIFVVSIWSLAFYASRMLREDMQRQLGNDQISTASVLAAEVNQGLIDRFGVLGKVAGRITPDMLSKPANLQAYLEERLILQEPFNGGAFVTGLDGTALASIPVSVRRVGVNYMFRDHISAALKEGKSTISSVVIGKILRAPVFSLAVPIRDKQGQVIGAMVGVINLNKFNFLDRVTGNRYGKTGGFLLVTPTQRLIVTATDKSRTMEVLPAPGINLPLDRFLQGYEGSDVFVNPRGVEVLASAKSIPAGGWYIAAILPTKEAFSPIYAMQQRMLLITIFLTLLAGGLTWWMLRRQLSPIFDTVKTLATFSGSNQPVQLLPITRQDEIGELIGAFNRLLESLGKREQALAESEERFRSLMENIPNVAVQGYALDGTVKFWNRASELLYGYQRTEVLGANLLNIIIPPEMRDGVAGAMQQMIETGEPIPASELLLMRKDGSRVPVFSSHALVNATDRQPELFCLDIDLTERKQAEALLQQSEQRYRLLIETANEGIVVAQGNNLKFVNKKALELSGYTEEELISLPFIEFIYYDDRELMMGNFQKRLKGEPVDQRYQVRILTKDRNMKWVEMSGAQIEWEGQPATLNFVTDITERKEYERRLEHIAHFDALTNLPNRTLLADRLHQSMTQAQRRRQPLAVAYLDLDGFKTINDNYGHDVGDQLLMTVATRMKNTLREGDTLARLGGDEFVAVLLDLEDAAASIPMLNRLLAAAAEPVLVGELVLQISASLGVTFYPQTDDIDADQLLRQADQAMYQAKLGGKNRYHVFDAAQDNSIRGHHESLEHIRHALAKREFVLYYQPKVDMRTGAVIGAEALIRWQHPEKGLLPPAVFLPVIEDHPLAIEIGEWVIDTALTQMELWHAAGLDIPVSVNVGARQLQQAGFVERLQEIMAAHPNVLPCCIELEVLETSALEDLAQVTQVIEACREIGVRFALDDFGTGYSSLTYLKHLPVTLLKIDQSFVRDMLDDPDDMAILQGVLSLATAFRREVIAEGVETIEHGEMLLQLGCELAQGYGIARPMPAAEMPGWAAAWRNDPSWDGMPEVHRDDLPLLFAGVEHRAWIAALVTYLNDARAAPPAMDHHQCHFSQWLSTEGLAHHGAQPSFQTITLLHEQVHQLAAGLLQLHADGRNQEALARLGELHDLRDALLAQLKNLVQASR